MVYEILNQIRTVTNKVSKIGLLIIRFISTRNIILTRQNTIKTVSKIIEVVAVLLLHIINKTINKTYIYFLSNRKDLLKTHCKMKL